MREEKSKGQKSRKKYTWKCRTHNGLHHTSEDPDIEEAECATQVVASMLPSLAISLTWWQSFSQKEDMGEGQITGTTWMVELGTYKTQRKNIAKVMEYKEDGQNWLLLTTLVALTLIILFSEVLKFSKK